MASDRLEWQWDQRLFDKTLEEYQKVSSRTFAEIINTKAYYVARKALWFTRKAEVGVIKSQLGTIHRSTKTVKYKGLFGGKMRRRVTTYRMDLTPGRSYEDKVAPLAVLLVQAKAREAGRPSPWAGKSRSAGASAMAAAVRNLIVARIRSISFLKAGWLPSIKVFESLAEKSAPLPAKDARQYGQAKGRGIPAKWGFSPRAVIENYARTIKDPRFDALEKHGAPALQRAFDDEAASMWEYIKRKMDPDAAKFNAQQKG